MDEAKVQEWEMKLRPPERELKPYPPKYIELFDGKLMVVREAKREEVPILLEAVEPLMKVEKDFYDIVAARVYGELLAWYRHRVLDEFCLVGTVGGVIAGLVNSRLVNDDVGMSYHTIAIRRGSGAHLFAAKMEHHIEILNQKEVLIVAESPRGFMRWQGEYNLEYRPEVPHELGGVPTYVLTRQLHFNEKERLVKGTRPVPPELLATADKLILPDEYPQIPGWHRSKK